MFNKRVPLRHSGGVQLNVTRLAMSLVLIPSITRKKKKQQCFCGLCQTIHWFPETRASGLNFHLISYFLGCFSPDLNWFASTQPLPGQYPQWWPEGSHMSGQHQLPQQVCHIFLFFPWHPHSQHNLPTNTQSTPWNTTMVSSINPYCHLTVLCMYTMCSGYCPIPLPFTSPIPISPHRHFIPPRSLPELMTFSFVLWAIWFDQGVWQWICLHSICNSPSITSKWDKAVSFPFYRAEKRDSESVHTPPPHLHPTKLSKPWMCVISVWKILGPREEFTANRPTIILNIQSSLWCWC